MPRYYFQVQVGGTLIPDEDGLELANLDRARTLALRNLAETAGDLLAEDGEKCLLEMRVTDADAHLLLQYRLTFEAPHDGQIRVS
jgi:hypothetical protein